MDAVVENVASKEKGSVQIDPRHRYGHNLHFYYDVWPESKSSQPFSYWLDIGDGKDVNLEKHPRSVMQKQCIRYLCPIREAYEVIVEDGRLMFKQHDSEQFNRGIQIVFCT